MPGAGIWPVTHGVRESPDSLLYFVDVITLSQYYVSFTMVKKYKCFVSMNT
ncbi:hypothetical protein C8N40_103436 [Pontibacter mucosus]|uniref:Uncharacterized protein n=1 Tax=Pontibacter mucosus TaxID=1649266 RepID=A0A2T5YM11_9BACT|nr:hypothetical protein C8N40_103436 [Pontibacter mucosus]